MSRLIPLCITLLLLCTGLSAQEENERASTDGSAARPADEPTAERMEPAGTSPDRPKTMSGMSILGNEEAPKSLVIVPWKSSRLGDDPYLTGSLDERARPVDKEVFLRELSYYDIRSGN
jgi:hypothetical protein